jgi:hypothetical protein
MSHKQTSRIGYAVIRLVAAVFVCGICFRADGAESDWRAENGFRFKELAVSKERKTGFTLLTSQQTGISFTNTLTEIEGAANRILLDGSGVALGDIDNDGRPDIFLCGLTTPNMLYKNLGDWRFRDVTDQAGLRFSGKYFRGAVFADINGDRSPDLLVTATGRGVLCYLNDGRGKFTDATQAAGITSKLGSMTLALADVDGNGSLDLYVVNYRAEDIRDRGQANLQLVGGQLTVPPWFKDRLLVVNGQVMEYGEPDQLYLNDGKGRFTPVSWTDGAFLDEDGKKLSQPPLDWGLSAAFRDFNNDGAPDLYVCNDYWTPDRVWLNDGRGRFRAIPQTALRNTSASSMGVDFADIDRDGNLDFFVVDMLSRDRRLRKRQIPAYAFMTLPPEAFEIRPQFMRNTLFHSRGDGTFEEIANFSGVSASEWSWQPVFIDVDLDGYEDLLITTGHSRDVQDLDATAAIEARQHSWRGYTNEVERQQAFTQERMMHNRLYPDLQMPIIAFHNRGDLTFIETTGLWGTDRPGVHHGIATADLDGDGDLDLVVNNLESAASLYRNESNSPRVAVRLRGLPPNTEGIGARIKVSGGPVDQSQEMIAGGRYLSGDDGIRVFAAGNGTNDLRIEVTWRNGKRSVVEKAKANRVYEIDEAESAAEVKGPKSKVQESNVSGVETSTSASSSRITHHASLLFQDISHLLNHTHVDEAFDDFSRQPLLPRKLSQLGPGVAWFDLNRDGWDDLIIGSGRGGRLSVFLNNGKGGFSVLQEPRFAQPITRDQTTVLGWQEGNGKTILLAGSANYEDGLAVGTAVRQFNFGQRTIDDSLPSQTSSTGPLALVDMDGDGDLDLFVGGRCVPGRWPEAASSMLFRSNNGRWEMDSEHTKALTKIGLVNGALWSDLDEDGFSELILACEWGPLRVFKNNAGKLREVTAELGLDKHKGWWNGITTGDIDGDGKLDIVAANWGLNSSYHASADRPLRLYYGDFFQRGTVDLIETEFDPATQILAPRRMLNSLAGAIPFLRERFPTHKAFSEASGDDVLKVLPIRTQEVQVTTLASMIFFNLGNRFEPVELPREAQLAPAFGVSVADFDGDGDEDIFLSQNFFQIEPETPRLDAGRGLLLRGNRSRKVSAVGTQESGLEVYGEQRGAAVSDFDGDGRLDLVVTQNGGLTRLFRNIGAEPGLRVRLKGPEGNPAGVGATLHLVFEHSKGVLHEVRAGSGYWSQDGGVRVIGLIGSATHVIVRWPGGRATTTAIPPLTKEVTIDSKGTLILRVP